MYAAGAAAACGASIVPEPGGICAAAAAAAATAFGVCEAASSGPGGGRCAVLDTSATLCAVSPVLPALVRGIDIGVLILQGTAGPASYRQAVRGLMLHRCARR